jgi:CRISPR-associated exonuclease Cas4
VRQDDLLTPEGRGTEKLAEGRLTEANSYERRAAAQEGLSINQDGYSARIDYYDPQAQRLHETKNSPAIEPAHELQAGFYLWLLNRAGLPAAEAVLEYPRLRQRHELPYDAALKQRVEEALAGVQAVMNAPACPPVLRDRRCKSCAFYDFCYAE